MGSFIPFLKPKSILNISDIRHEADMAWSCCDTSLSCTTSMSFCLNLGHRLSDECLILSIKLKVLLAISAIHFEADVGWLCYDMLSFTLSQIRTTEGRMQQE